MFNSSFNYYKNKFIVERSDNYAHHNNSRILDNFILLCNSSTNCGFMYVGRIKPKRKKQKGSEKIMPIKYEIWYLLFCLIVYSLVVGFYFSRKEEKEKLNLKKKG